MSHFRSNNRIKYENTKQRIKYGFDPGRNINCVSLMQTWKINPDMQIITHRNLLELLIKCHMKSIRFG